MSLTIKYFFCGILLLFHQSWKLNVLVMNYVQRRLIVGKLVAVNQSLMGIISVPLGLCSPTSHGVGQHVDGSPKDVRQAIQFAFGNIVTVKTFICLQKLDKLVCIGDSFHGVLVSDSYFYLERKCVIRLIPLPPLHHLGMTIPPESKPTILT